MFAILLFTDNFAGYLISHFFEVRALGRACSLAALRYVSRASCLLPCPIGRFRQHLLQVLGIVRGRQTLVEFLEQGKSLLIFGLHHQAPTLPRSSRKRPGAVIVSLAALA